MQLHRTREQLQFIKKPMTAEEEERLRKSPFPKTQYTRVQEALRALPRLLGAAPSKARTAPPAGQVSAKSEGVRAMVDFIHWSGCRPNEACKILGGEGLRAPTEEERALWPEATAVAHLFSTKTKRPYTWVFTAKPADCELYKRLVQAKECVLRKGVAITYEMLKYYWNLVMVQLGLKMNVHCYHTLSSMRRAVAQKAYERVLLQDYVVDDEEEDNEDEDEDEEDNEDEDEDSDMGLDDVGADVISRGGKSDGTPRKKGIAKKKQPTVPVTKAGRPRSFKQAKARIKRATGEAAKALMHAPGSRATSRYITVSHSKLYKDG